MINEQFLAQLNSQSLLFFIILARFVATFATVSFFRKEFVSPKVVIFFSMTLSAFVLLYGQLAQIVVLIPSGALFVNLAMQLFLGILTGFVVNLFVDVFLALGQLVSAQSGLGFVSFYVPKIGTITPLSQFFFITAAVVFFELNAHLLLVKMIIETFKTPLSGIETIDLDVLKQVMIFTKIIFSASLMLSLALLISLLVANMTLAIMTKFSPQLNIFSIGITLSLITGFFVLYMCFDAITEHGRILLNDIMYFCSVLMLGLKTS